MTYEWMPALALPLLLLPTLTPTLTLTLTLILTLSLMTQYNPTSETRTLILRLALTTGTRGCWPTRVARPRGWQGSQASR